MTAHLKVGIIDYGMGNLSSVYNALDYIGGTDTSITDDALELKHFDSLILPGVGAFGDAILNLKKRNMIDSLNEFVLKNKKPILAICLGMQLLFDRSEEDPMHKGFGWIAGKVKRFNLDNNYRVPHIGWNDITITNGCKLFKGIENDKNFYFVHSYCAVCNESYIAATCEYGDTFIAAVQKDNILGTQFHPERSHHNGLTLLKNHLDLIRGSV